MIKSINPATLQVIQEYQEHSWEETDQIIRDTDAAFSNWRKTKIDERSNLLLKLADAFLAQKESLGRICSLEMGKPLSEAVAEVEKCALVCKYYAENAESFLASELIKSDAQKSFVSYEPLGVILAVMPWNFPFWQVMRFAAPGLIAGNGAVLKHSSNTFGCALALEKIFKEVGFPENIFRVLLISSKQVEKVIEHPLVRGVTLTGSTAAGRSVAEVAGRSLKKTVLELGGSDAYVILADADLDHAAKTLVKGRLRNAGQSCISPKRLIALSSVYAQFKDKVELEMKDKSFGDPLQSSTYMGAMARVDLRDELHDQVERTVRAGAECVLGGKIPSDEGSFYPPTLLVNVKPGMAAFDEELFGPVVCLIEAKDEEEAFKLANQSDYGLGGGIFSRDVERAQKLATEKMESGNVFINEFVQSDPRLPFGGIKDSGYGRELSLLGIREFVNAKTVFVK